MTQVRCADNIVDDDDSADMYQLSKGQLIEKITQLEADKAQMKADFQSFNHHLNRTARYFNWCSDYEDRLATYARDMKILTPTYREKEELGSQPDSYKASPACKACERCGGQCFLQCCQCNARWRSDCS